MSVTCLSISTLCIAKRFGRNTFLGSAMKNSSSRRLEGLKHQTNASPRTIKEMPKVMPIFTGFKMKHAPSGNIYVGDWLNGQYHGHGKMVYRANAQTKVGLVKEIMSGEGVHMYVGQWFKNRRHGQGIITYPNGSSFKGKFVDGELVSGNGLIFLPKGKIYEGEVQGGKEHGLGKITHENGQTLEGLFREGKLVKGSGVTIAKDGTVCVGTYEAGRRHGQCVVTYPDGRTLSGEFRNGLIYNGKGLLKLYASATKSYDGSELEGEWRDGEFVVVNN